MNKISWEKLDNYIRKPVWDNSQKNWRVLEGYQNWFGTHMIAFHGDEWEEKEKDNLNLFESEVENEK